MSRFPHGPLVIAHRGDSANHPENTLAAFAAAEQAGADAIELDVRLSSDGVPVALHDEDVAATTDGHGSVHRLTVAALKRLDASGARGERAEVPTLREVLDTVGIPLDIEIKNLPGEGSFDSPDERALLATLDALDERAFAHPVLISSFNWLTIERCRALRPEIDTGFLTVGAVDPLASLAYARDEGHPWILPQAPALLEAGAAAIAEARAAGIRVGTWTVDDPEAAGRLFAMGVDAVATNDPRALVAARASGEHREGVGDRLEQ